MCKVCVWFGFLDNVFDLFVATAEYVDLKHIVVELAVSVQRIIRGFQYMEFMQLSGTR